MRSKLLHEQREKTYVVVFEPGEEVTAGLLQFANHNHLSAVSPRSVGSAKPLWLPRYREKG